MNKALNITAGRSARELPDAEQAQRSLACCEEHPWI
jgi:hypothetical protein